MNDQTAEQIESLREWLLDHAPEGTEITEDTVLAEGILIDSFQFVELLVFLEELRDIPIDSEDMGLDNFRTLRTIIEAFLTPTAEPVKVSADG
jgi:acyl carrier protein